MTNTKLNFSIQRVFIPRVFNCDKGIRNRKKREKEKDGKKVKGKKYMNFIYIYVYRRKSIHWREIV